MKGKLLSGLIIIVFLISLAACGSLIANKSGDGDSDSSGFSNSGSKKIGILMPTKTLERWNKDAAYLEDKFKSEGYEVRILFSENDTDRQADDIHELISDGADVLIVAAIDGEMLTDALKEAKDKNIPVISYDRLIMNTDAVSYYVSFDNYKVGSLQGQYIIDKLDLDNAGDKTYNMEIVAGDSNDNNAKFFYSGAMDLLKDYIDTGIIKIVSGQSDFEAVATAQWSMDEAMERMRNVLASYYADGTSLDICLCSNDATALGVTNAIVADYTGKNMPVITGQDADEANLENIITGKQSMTVFKALENEAIVTFEIVREILKDEIPDKSICNKVKCECSYDTVSYDNGTGVIPAYLLTPEIVTKDNYKEKLVDTGYYKIGEDGYPEAAE